MTLDDPSASSAKPSGTDLPPGEVAAATLRSAMRAAHMVPLWESPTAHKQDVAREQSHIWPWRETRPIMVATGEIRSPEVVERRVVSLVNPRSRSAEDEATCGAISATLQMMLPGERARPHRHSMNALRFILEGRGAETIVDGKRCMMTPGDLIITPAWCWHEHVSNGDIPTIWFDVLDVALHLFLGTDAFEPGPCRNVTPQWNDDAFASVGVVPAHQDYRPNHSPLFRYPWSDVTRALQATPIAPDGARRVRYIDPLRGQSVMPLLDCSALSLDGAASTRPFRSSASAVCCVVEGHGSSEIGDKTISWSPKDVFTLPGGAWSSHKAIGGKASLFIVSNREVYGRLGLLREEWGE